MHIELTKETIRIIPDTVQDEAFIEKNLLTVEGFDKVKFERVDQADTFYLESLAERL